MADVKGLLADPEFQKLDLATQKSTLGRVDPAFSKLSDDDYASFRQRMGNAPERPHIAPIEFTNEMLSNIPGSAAKLAGNIYQAVRHPIDTASNLVNTAAEIGQKMTPGWKNPTPHADAAIQGLKDRYGSPEAIANTVKTDPVGVAADVSALAGGASGIARGVGAVADAANLPRAASAANALSRGAAVASDVTNPVNLVTKPVSAMSKGVGRGLTRNALKLGGRTERYGATPAQAALEETSGITPSAIKASATQRLADLNAELEALAQASGNKADLTAARQVIKDEITKIERANGDPAQLREMLGQLTEPKPGFGGAVDPATGDIAAQQDPMPFLGMKRQFGDDWTKFDYSVPLKDSTRATGNKAYHELSQESNRAIPGAQPINQKIQSLVPVRQGAQRAEEGAGATERIVDRSTRPTGGLAAILYGLHERGIFGAAAMAAAQEILSSPTAKMAAARGLYGAGKAAGSPMTSRALNAAGVAGEINANDPNFGKIPQFAKGGIVRKPTLAIVGEKGPEAIVPLKRPPKLDTPKAERHLINSLMYRAMEGARPPRLETPRK